MYSCSSTKCTYSLSAKCSLNRYTEQGRFNNCYTDEGSNNLIIFIQLFIQQTKPWMRRMASWLSSEVGKAVLVNPVAVHCTRVPLYSSLPSILSTVVLWLLVAVPVISKVMPRDASFGSRSDAELLLQLISETLLSWAEQTNLATSTREMFTDEGSLVRVTDSPAIVWSTKINKWYILQRYATGPYMNTNYQQSYD